MNIDLSIQEMVCISAALGMLTEVIVNPAVVPALSPPGRDTVTKLKAKGQWPTTNQTMQLLDKLVARLQVEME
jgi:hypothetical protein